MRVLISLIILLVSSLAAPARGETLQRLTIELLPQAEVTGEQVLLGQVARLGGEGAKGPWAALDLGSAPPPGCSRVIESGYVRLRARRYGLSPDEAQWQGARVRVSRPAAAAPAPFTTPPVALHRLNWVACGF